MKSLSNSELIEGIRSGDKRLLGKAITLVESKKPEHRKHSEKFYRLLGNQLELELQELRVQENQLLLKILEDWRFPKVKKWQF